MPAVFGSILLKLLAPLVGIVAALAISLKGGFSWTEDLRLEWPAPGRLAFWVIAWTDRGGADIPRRAYAGQIRLLSKLQPR